MAEHIWSVLCYRGVVDKNTNNVSILDVTEVIRSKTPVDLDRDETVGVTLQPPLHVVTLWMRSDLGAPETFEFRTTVIAPDGSEFPPARREQGNLEEHRRLRTFCQIPILPVRGEGLYRVTMQWRRGPDDPWNTVARIPLEVGSFKVASEAAAKAFPRPKTAIKTRRRSTKRGK